MSESLNRATIYLPEQSKVQSPSAIPWHDSTHRFWSLQEMVQLFLNDLVKLINEVLDLDSRLKQKITAGDMVIDEVSRTEIYAVVQKFEKLCRDCEFKAAAD